jgi:Mlc titration factor MtfA (ptsG expression regulator)
MLDWLRRRRAAPGIPDALWHDLLIRYPFLAERPEDDIRKLRELSARFLSAKEFHGANGFVITDEVGLAIAAQAVLPVLHLGLGWYDDFVGIVVHPSEVVARRTVTDDDGVVHDYSEVLAGEAMDGGPVMLNWHDVRDAGATTGQGYNVVIHEFVHKIDMRDGAPDGCPPLASRGARKTWLATMKAEFEAFREKSIIAERFGGETPWLDSYAATSIDEFFAVACEGFFVNPQRFSTEFPALHSLFQTFFAGARDA